MEAGANNTGKENNGGLCWKHWFKRGGGAMCRIQILTQTYMACFMVETM